MKALTRKLWRDLWRQRFQGFTIALVAGCGIASFVSAVTAYQSVRSARDHFYDSGHFADVFAHLDRAPRPLLDRLRALPGVAAVEGRVAGDFRVELPGTSEPVVLRFVSSPASAGGLNEIFIDEGRPVEPGSADEIVVSDLFAETWKIRPGATISAVINGRRAKLRVVGLGTSPEFIWAVSARGFPDPWHFGVARMDGDALARAMGRSGAFNDASLQLAVGANEKEVIGLVDRLLEPYGGLGAVGRADQSSSKLVNQKLEQLRKQAVAMPLIFLGVAAFLLNVLLSRIVATQREQIATMKALGYRTRELAWHYLQMAAAICLVGTLLGLGLGILGGQALVRMYAGYFRLPEIHFVLNLGTVAAGAMIAALAAVSGTLVSVRRAVAIPPAEAMRPEPPASFSRTPLERIGLYRLLSPAVRMVVRDLERRPVRLLLSSASIALATAITVIGGVAQDSINETLRLQFEVSHREDFTVTLDKARPYRAIRDLQHLPGVRYAEGERMVPVRLRAGPRFRTTALIGLRRDAALHQLLDATTRPLALPVAGLSLSRVLGEELDVRAGDEVEVEVLEAGRRRFRLPVAALVDDLLGITGYMEAYELAAVLDEPPLANVALLAVDRAARDEVALRLEALPAVAALSRPEIDRGLFRDQVADVYFVLQVMLALFGAAIAVGVVYNNARIAFEVRSRDLATLRILGFTRGELAVVLLGEQAVQLILGIVPGLRLGAWMGAKMLSSIDREMLRAVMTLSPAPQVAAACVILLAASLSALRVRGQSDRLDLVAVLKARD